MEVLVPFLVEYIKDRIYEKQQQEGGGQVLDRSAPEEQMDFGAWINNTFEMRVDAYNLIRQSQRPYPNGSSRSGLGAWSAIDFFGIIVADAANVGLLTWRTSVVEYLTSSEGDSSASEFKWIFFIILSILLALIVALEKWIIRDIQLVVEQPIERQRLITSALILSATVDPNNDKPPEVMMDCGMMMNIHVLYQIQMIIRIDIDDNYMSLGRWMMNVYSEFSKGAQRAKNQELDDLDSAVVGDTETKDDNGIGNPTKIGMTPAMKVIVTGTKGNVSSSSTGGMAEEHVGLNKVINMEGGKDHSPFGLLGVDGGSRSNSPDGMIVIVVILMLLLSFVLFCLVYPCAEWSALLLVLQDELVMMKEYETWLIKLKHNRYHVIIDALIFIKKEKKIYVVH